MASLVPLIDVDRQTLTIRLDGVECRLTIWWQPGTQSWHVSMEVPVGVPIVSGRALAVGQPVLGNSRRSLLPGDIWCLPTGEAPVEPGPWAWRDRTHRLVYSSVRPVLTVPSHVAALPYTPTYRPPAATVPPAPDRPYADPGDMEVSLHFSPRGDGGSVITGWDYRLRIGSGLFGNWQPIAGATADTTSTIVSPLVNGSTYRFQVRAVNAVGPGAPSDTSEPVTPGSEEAGNIVMWRSGDVVWRAGDVTWR